MGRDVEQIAFSREDRRRYRQKVARCLDVFARMLAGSAFEAGTARTGLEVELNLVDADGDPAPVNGPVLAALGEGLWQNELAQFNIEVNLPPRAPAEGALHGFQADLTHELNRAEEAARLVSARTAMIGILPTVWEKHLGTDSLSPNPRYALLDEQILAARGEDLTITITGTERLVTETDTIALEAACTSVQIHVQVSPVEFAAYWNAAQAVAGAQLAVGANSPFLFGRRLWAETRIPLFEQAADSRPEELKAQGVRPRVWFGERWITSVFDLFEENTRYFPALLPICSETDPVEVFEAGGVPELDELTLHNGTIYRWNRPVYAVTDGVPHLRVENRVLPAGPTVVDAVANAAFFLGVVRGLATETQPVWTRLAYGAARDNFRAGARHGIEAQLHWPDAGPGGDGAAATDLVLRHLLPLAADGLAGWGVPAAEADPLLGIIEARCIRRVNGASWQTEALSRLESRGRGRQAALRDVTARYLDHMHSGEPVHTWPLP